MASIILPSFKNSTKGKKRRRGHVHGRYCGKGLKGEKARAGRKHIQILEGGQMPLVRRIPKRGFSNVKFSNIYEVINLSLIQKCFEEGEEINVEKLIQKSAISGKYPVKLLANGEINKSFIIKLDKVSENAKKKIIQAKGRVIEATSEKTTGSNA
ncbi:MAG: 50S ribosomal protein L15 [Planctomycetota bacterium]